MSGVCLNYETYFRRVQKLKHYFPVLNISPLRLLVFVFFVGLSSLIWTLDSPPLPHINFPDFVLQIFQRLLKWIVLNKEPQKQSVNEMEQEEQEYHHINTFDFSNNI